MSLRTTADHLYQPHLHQIQSHASCQELQQRTFVHNSHRKAIRNNIIQFREKSAYDFKSKFQFQTKGIVANALLLGISLCFLSTFTLIQKPNNLTCIFSRLVYSFKTGLHFFSTVRQSSQFYILSQHTFSLWTLPTDHWIK